MANNNLREVLKKLIQKTLNWVKSNCVNNLLSTATNLPLAAAQGKVLDEKIGEVTQSLSKITVVKEYQNLDTTLNGMSQASNFNNYTVDEDGLYYISTNLFGSKSATSRTLIGVQKNGIAITTEHNGSGYYGIEASHIYQCTVGDTISGRFYNEVAQTNKTNNLLCQIVRLK